MRHRHQPSRRREAPRGPRRPRRPRRLAEGVDQGAGSRAGVLPPSATVFTRRYAVKRNHTWILAILLLLASLAPAQAAVEVRLKLPQRAKLDLTGRKTLAVAPFIVVSQEGE